MSKYSLLYMFSWSLETFQELIRPRLSTPGGSYLGPPPPYGWGPQASAFDLWNPYPLTYEKGNHVLYEHYHYEARATNAGSRDLRGR